MDKMNDPENEGYSCAIKTVLGLFLLLLLVPAVWLFLAYNSKYRQCVQLENGLNLGYEAVFDLSGPFFHPTAVPRFPNGTPLIRDDMWALYVTNTTVYGLSYADEDEHGYRFAWRSDSGLVLKKDDPTLYEKLVAEAGHANWDFGSGSFGTGYLLNELIKRPQFQGHRCPTSLITW